MRDQAGTEFFVDTLGEDVSLHELPRLFVRPVVYDALGGGGGNTRKRLQLLPGRMVYVHRIFARIVVKSIADTKNRAF